MSDPLISTTFAYFEIRERIKPGGMAIVYKAYDTTRKQIVALKILQENLALHDDIVSRFKQEGTIAARLRHPNIVQFLDFGQFGNRLYIAMEYMAGGSMVDQLNTEAILPLSRTAEILRQIGSALDYAHHEGVVHRDLKLGNILIDEIGRAMLTDFGIARMLDATQTLTAPNQQMPGTVKYMSPEQVRGTTDLDFRSDLYSFAVIGYLLATGRYPFTGTNDIVILNQHLNMTVPLPTKVNHDLPAALNDVLMRGLAKVSEQRYPSAGDFADAFAQAIRGYERAKVNVNMRADNPALPPERDDITRFDASPISVNGVDDAPPRRSSSPLSRPVLFAIAAITAVMLMIGTVFIGGRGASVTLSATPSTQMLVAESTETFIPSETPTLTPSLTATDTPSQAPTLTYTPTATATDTPSQTPTLTYTPSATPTLTPTVTDTPSATPTDTPTVTLTYTPTATATDTPTLTPTAIPTFTPTARSGATATAVFTRTPTLTPTPLFITRPALLASFDQAGTPSQFNCRSFSASYEFMIDQIAAENAIFLPLQTLVDEVNDPLLRVYEECQVEENLNNPEGSITFDLYSDLLEALEEFGEV